ncbi:hypothetical protein, partial [Ideonella sp. A 288]|uniref:hypothetical protein n=1 Tax=Ideonella sp. A 288 TaxID=1962181 RepID=UPI001F2EC52B
LLPPPWLRPLLPLPRLSPVLPPPLLTLLPAPPPVLPLVPLRPSVTPPPRLPTLSLRLSRSKSQHAAIATKKAAFGRPFSCLDRPGRAGTIPVDPT